MSRYLFHPKALPVSNIVEGFFEEHRRIIANGTQHNRKAVNYVAGDRSLVLMRPTNSNSLEQQPLQGQAVSPAAPLNTPVPGYAVAVALGFTICAGAFSLAFAIYWILRIYL